MTDWLGLGEPHGRTAARVAAQQMAARVGMCAPIEAAHITMARRTLRAATGEWDRVDLQTMIDLAVYLHANEGGR